jgi:MFS family permease
VFTIPISQLADWYGRKSIFCISCAICAVLGIVQVRILTPCARISRDS